jgi:hypothetical protein
MEKRKFLTLPGLELRPLGRPASSQSLHRVRYPGYQNNMVIVINDSGRLCYIEIAGSSIYNATNTL